MRRRYPTGSRSAASRTRDRAPQTRGGRSKAARRRYSVGRVKMQVVHGVTIGVVVQAFAQAAQGVELVRAQPQRRGPRAAATRGEVVAEGRDHRPGPIDSAEPGVDEQAGAHLGRVADVRLQASGGRAAGRRNDGRSKGRWRPLRSAARSASRFSCRETSRTVSRSPARACTRAYQRDLALGAGDQLRVERSRAAVAAAARTDRRRRR